MCFLFLLPLILPFQKEKKRKSESIEKKNEGKKIMTLTLPAFLRSWTQLCSPRMSLAEKRKLLANLTRGYVAITDSPANTFVEELVELYPDAIVIVTTREREEWWVSAKELFKKTDMTWLDVLLWPVGTLRWFGEWREAMKRR